MSLISASLGLLWFAVFWLLTRDRQNSAGLTLIGIGASLITVTIAVFPRLNGYEHDSFWTLTPIGRTGVIAISSIGIIGVFTLINWLTSLVLKTRRQVSATAWLLFNLAAGWGLFGAVFSLSPQVFYTFYQFTFSGLPNQWVIDTLFDTARLQTIAAIPIGGSLSDHLAGMTLWAIIPFTIWRHLRHWWQGQIS